MSGVRGARSDASLVSRPTSSPGNSTTTTPTRPSTSQASRLGSRTSGTGSGYHRTGELSDSDEKDADFGRARPTSSQGTRNGSPGVRRLISQPNERNGTSVSSRTNSRGVTSTTGKDRNNRTGNKASSNSGLASWSDAPEMSTQPSRGTTTSSSKGDPWKKTSSPTSNTNQSPWMKGANSRQDSGKKATSKQGNALDLLNDVHDISMSDSEEDAKQRSIGKDKGKSKARSPSPDAWGKNKGSTSGGKKDTRGRSPSPDAWGKSKGSTSGGKKDTRGRSPSPDAWGKNKGSTSGGKKDTRGRSPSPDAWGKTKGSTSGSNKDTRNTRSSPGSPAGARRVNTSTGRATTPPHQQTQSGSPADSRRTSSPLHGRPHSRQGTPPGSRRPNDNSDKKGHNSPWRQGMKTNTSDTSEQAHTSSKHSGFTSTPTKYSGFRRTNTNTTSTPNKDNKLSTSSSSSKRGSSNLNSGKGTASAASNSSAKKESGFGNSPIRGASSSSQTRSKPIPSFDPVDPADELIHLSIHMLQFLKTAILFRTDTLPVLVRKQNYTGMTNALRDLGQSAAFHSMAVDILDNLPQEDFSSYARLKERVQNAFLECVRAVSDELKEEMHLIGDTGPRQWPMKRVLDLLAGANAFDSYMSGFTGILGTEQRRRMEAGRNNDARKSHENIPALKPATALSSPLVSHARDCMLGLADMLALTAVGRARLAVAEGGLKRVDQGDGADLANTLELIYRDESRFFSDNYQVFQVKGQSRQIEFVENIYLDLSLAGVTLTGTEQEECQQFYLGTFVYALSMALPSVDRFELVRRIREHNPLALSTVAERGGDEGRFDPFLSPLRPVFIARRDMWLSRNLALVSRELAKEDFHPLPPPDEDKHKKPKEASGSAEDPTTKNSGMERDRLSSPRTGEGRGKLPTLSEATGEGSEVDRPEDRVSKGTQAVLLALASLRYALSVSTPHKDLTYNSSNAILSLAVSKYSEWIETFPATNKSLASAAVIHNDLLHLGDLVTELLHAQAGSTLAQQAEARRSPAKNAALSSGVSIGDDHPAPYQRLDSADARAYDVFRVQTKRYLESILLLQARVVELACAKADNAVAEACTQTGGRKGFFKSQTNGDHPSDVVHQLLSNMLRPVSKVLMYTHRRTRTSILPRLYACVVNGYLDFIRSEKIKIRLAEAQQMRVDQNALERFCLNKAFVLPIDTDLLLGSGAHLRFKAVLTVVEGGTYTGPELADQKQWLALKK